MNKKTFIAFLIVVVITLTIFCGCNNTTTEGTITPDEAIVTSDSDASVNSDDTVTAEENTAVSKNEEEYAPEHRDENEMEIMTVPQEDSQNDSQESNDAQDSTNAPEEPDIEDYIPAGSGIELPFVPAE